MSSLGLASHIEVHPGMDRFDNPSKNITHKSSIPGISHILGFEDNPNWDSDTLQDPEDAKVTDHPKASNRFD
jgi:hypothetical protein